jgi:hypothetical protein
MPKKFLEDMVKSKRAMEVNKKVFKPEEIQVIQKRIEYIEVERSFTPKSKSRYLLWFVALFSMVFCFFAISLLFAKAKIVITPKINDVVLNENLVATKDSSAGGLSFDLVVIPGEDSKNITVSGEKSVSINATGTVVIFNGYSSSPQTLSVNTKLQGSNGKVYLTQNKIIVPGVSKDGTPGQVEVGITAAVAGVEYNSDPLDFTIIGFKGTAKYSKFTVRSKAGTTITGGFVGNAPDISQADLDVAQGELKTTLQNDLLMKATAQIPDGFILFKDATFLDTNDSDMSSVYNPDGSATLTLSGTFYGIILNEQQLTQKIATDNIDKYDGSDVYISNIKDLVFSMSANDSTSNTTATSTAATNTTTVDTSSADSNSIATAQTINFNLSGPAKIVWKVDVDKFTSDLLGRSKSDFSQILSQYPNIDSATLTITPIWKPSIPSQTKNVKVIVNYPN